MYRSSRCWLLILAAAQLLPTRAASQPPKAPALPAIAPAQARLDQTIGGLDGPGVAIAYSERTGTLAAACEQGTIQYWNKGVGMGVRVGDRTPNVLTGHQGPITALACGGGPPLVASAGVDKSILLWSLPGGNSLTKLPTAAIVRALSMTGDGKLLASAGDDSGIQLWDIATGKPGAKLMGNSDWVLCLAFSSDGKFLACGGYESAVRLWDVAAGKKLLEIPAQPPTPPPSASGANKAVLAVAFSPDNKQLAFGGTDAQIHLVNAADGKFMRSLPGHGSSVTSLAFHPSGTLLASASKDRTVRLWNPASGQAIKVLEGHSAWVQGLTFLAEGTRLASVGADQTVRLWDLSAPPK